MNINLEQFYTYKFLFSVRRTQTTSLETGILVGATALFSFVLAGIAYETGVMIGSLIVAGILPCRRE